MENVIDALHRLIEQGAIEDGTWAEIDLQPVEVAPVAGAQIVEHAHLGGLVKMFGDMAADETRAASDEDSHGKVEKKRPAWGKAGRGGKGGKFSYAQRLAG